MRRQYAVSSARWHPLARTLSVVAIIAHLVNLDPGGAQPLCVPAATIVLSAERYGCGRSAADIRWHGLLCGEPGVNQELAPQHRPAAVARCQGEPRRPGTARHEEAITLRSELINVLGHPVERRQLDRAGDATGEANDDATLQPGVDR